MKRVKYAEQAFLTIYVHGGNKSQDPFIVASCHVINDKNTFCLRFLVLIKLVCFTSLFLFL